ncbi:MAG: oxidoreductase [Bacteroidales bacterium]
MLFDTIEIKNLKFKNRIVMPPMCQYQATDGFANNWHLMHYTARAVGQVGTIIFEASAVEPRGRISMNDLGIWSDFHIEKLSEIVAECKKYGARVGIQLAHAGRKSRVIDEEIVAPSAIAFNEKFPVPHALSTEEIKSIVKKFGDAAKRATLAGFDFVEVHGAHGYLISEFLSPVTNKRNDDYGINRELFLEQILGEVHLQIPSEMPVFLRVSGEEYHENGNHPESMGGLLIKVSELFDVLHVSSGGIYDREKYDIYPAYQLEFANKLRKITGKPTIAVGRLENYELAEKALQENKADFIAVGKGLLSDAHWALHASDKMSGGIEWPESYIRAKGLI